MLGLCRAGGAARRAALSLESCLSPRLGATPAAAAARRTLRGEAEKKPEEELASDQRRAALSLGAPLSHGLAAIPAAADPNQRRAAQALLSPLLAANPTAAADARRTLCTEPENELSPTDRNDIWLYNRLSQLESTWAKELHDLNMESLKNSKDLEDAFEAYKRAIAQAKTAARKDALEKALGVGLFLSMALLIIRC